MVLERTPSSKALGRFLDAAGLNGLIVVAPASGAADNYDQAMAASRTVLSNALARLPVDPRRVVFGGYSGAVSVAVELAGGATGVTPMGLWLIGAGVGPEAVEKLPKQLAIAAIGSADHVRRWDVACATLKFNGDRTSKTWWHVEPNLWGRPELIVDSLSWLTGMGLSRERAGRPQLGQEREAWAAMILHRVEGRLAAEPEWAADWLDAISEMRLGGTIQTREKMLAQKLKGNPKVEAARKLRRQMDEHVAKRFATHP